MPKEDTEELLMSTAQVASALNTSRTTVWRMTKTGKLPAPVKLGASTRYRRSDIEKFVADLSEDQSGAGSRANRRMVE